MIKKEKNHTKGAICSKCGGEMRYAWCSVCDILADKQKPSISPGCECYLACANAVGYCLNNPDDPLCQKYVDACFSSKCSLKCPVT